MQSTSRSNHMVVSRQTPLRRSARFVVEVEIRNSKQEVSYKLARQGIRVRNQLKQMRSNFGGVFEEAQNGRRRSPRLASVTSVKTIEIPQQFPHRILRRRSPRLIGLDPVYECVKRVAKNPKSSDEPEAIIKSILKKGPKKDCESMRSQIRRSSRRLTAASKRGVTEEEVEEKVNADRGDLVLERRLGDGFSTRMTADLGKQKRRKMDVGNGEENRTKKIKEEDRHDRVGWTCEEEEALHKAYLKAKPSPHFWKKVSRMVPGKSAQDCFNKIHASIITPLSSQHRSKARAHVFSPIANFSLSDMIFPKASKLEAGRLGKTRTKKLAAHKTVRHLLRKHSINDRSKAIDRFTLLESSLINISSPAALRSPETSSLAQQPDTKSSSNSTMLSRFKLLNSPTAPSPEVLKQIKNRALHDRYIDQLHHREATRAMLAKKLNAGGVGGKSDRGGLKAARIALISDAMSFTKHFRDSRANPTHELDEGEDDDCYGDDDDVDGGDVDE